LCVATTLSTPRDLAGKLRPRFGVNLSTILNWKRAYPEFAQVLKGAKDQIDSQVETSLLRKALGFSYSAEKIVVVDGKPTVMQYTEQCLPSDTASSGSKTVNRRAGAM
jgi:hypothetical protein